MQGENFEEAEKMAKDAIRGYIKTLKDLNEEIPVESEEVIISRIPTVIPC